MSARLMEPGIAAAILAGRPIIVPSAQRAAALRWNWARLQLAQGHAVWETPQVLPWEAWLDAQWERARLAGRVPAALRRLNHSQQLTVWRRVLESLEGTFEGADELAQHAEALMASAARAVQWQLPLARLAVTDEERLLAEGLAAVRQWCEREHCMALALCTAPQLSQFVAGPAPLIVGQRQLTSLQAELAAKCWPDVQVLHTALPSDAVAPRLVVAGNLDEEIAACAQWCRARLVEDPQRRLLVVSVASSPSPAAQAAMLARELAAGSGEVPESVLERGLLAVEGGAMLAHQQLIADALAALRLLREPLAFDDLARVLGSAYLRWGDAAQMLALRTALAETGFAQWSARGLNEVLQRLADEMPVATVLAAWLGEARAWSGSGAMQGEASRVEWARRFSQWLGAAGFARGANLDSRDAQRLQRWSELLDEFAALDGIGAAVPLAAALGELLQLAEQARHAARSGDAAITFTTEPGAPLARHDGIWVLGLAEQRWPEPPRPDPYVPLSEQRRCGWDEASARHRLEQARWSLLQWTACTAELVLSHPRMEGDVHHRPSVLPGLPSPHDWQETAEWEASVGAIAMVEPFCTRPAVAPVALAPMVTLPDGAFRGGQKRLLAQQQCAFRGQAEMRLGARPVPEVSDGIAPALRGVLLHGVLDGLWRELQDQRALAVLPAAQRTALFDRHWSRQVAKLAAEGRLPHPARLLERERRRSERLVLRVLDIEASRPFFRVLYGERQVELATSVGVMTLRVDRLDEDEFGQHWLVDYKSGKAEAFGLAEGEARPLQLVLYDQALARQGVKVHGMALLSLSPVKTGYTAAAPEKGWMGSWQQVPDWDVQRLRWRAEIESLLHDHVTGHARVAPQRDACRVCHLAALCRRADVDDALDVDGAGDATAESA